MEVGPHPGQAELGLGVTEGSPLCLAGTGAVRRKTEAVYLNKTKSITDLNTHKQNTQTSEVMGNIT